MNNCVGNQNSEAGATLIEYVVATAIFTLALIALQLTYQAIANRHVNKVLMQQAERQSPNMPGGICLTNPDGDCY